MRHHHSARTLDCTPAHFHDEAERAEILRHRYLLQSWTRPLSARSLPRGRRLQGARRGHALYLRSEKARDRIRGDLGKDLRFVVILRDPVKRAWSHYLHECRHGVETESFERALELEPTRLSAAGPAWTAYFRGGLYARQLRVWFEVFPREHFLVLLTEDLAERPAAVARQAFAFLEVDPDVELPPPSPANVAWTPRYPRLAAALNPRVGMMATLKHLVPYSSRQRVRQTNQPVEPPAI